MTTLPVSQTVLKGEGHHATDRCHLTYEDRFLRRKVLTSDAGLRFMVDFEGATHIDHGDAFSLDNGTSIAVEAAPEDLVEITGDNLLRYAWHIGNRHTPCQVEPARLLIARDHVIEAMLTQLGASTRIVNEPFIPEGGAYGHGRTFGHDHGHTHHEHGHSHDHHHHHD